MEIDYWVIEYSKVFCGYLFLMFLWPSVVFHKHLRTKSRTYRFSFCVTVPIVIMNTVVLGLGLIHGLDQRLIRFLFYGVFLLAFSVNSVSYLGRKYSRMTGAEIPDLSSLKENKFVKQAVCFLCVDFMKKIQAYRGKKIRLRAKEEVWNSGRRFRHLFWRYGLLVIVTVYGMVYFSYGAFQVHSYGYGDLYIHNKWIYELTIGNIFPDGIYPEAMHCFIYCMHTLFGIKIHSILLFLQGIHVAVFLVSVYLLLGKVFSWRYTSVFVLMLFLTLDLGNADLIHSMFRLQITMPMEFGLHTVCLSALFMINYLDRERADKGNVIRRQFFWDENLLLFMIALAAVVMTHFHTMLMAVIICGSFGFFALKKICNRKYFIPLMSAVLCAFVIAVTPMAGALAQGTPFSASISWALRVMNGEESSGLQEQTGEDDAVTEENGTGKEKSGNDADQAQNREEGVWDIKRSEIGIISGFKRVVNEICDKGYAALYGKSRGRGAFVLTAVIAVLCWLTRKNKRFKFLHKVCRKYPPVILASLLYIVVYAAPMMGLPNVIPEGRFFAPGHMMLLGVMVMPVDVIICRAAGYGRDLSLRILSLASVAGIYGAAVATGNFRGMLFYELSRYNAAVDVTESIINTFPQYSYTIVSPTDELYHVIQYGWHEELLDFVERCESGESYLIPSEYVFIFVEKKPLLYRQSHFFQGRNWIGEEKYLEPFWEVYSAGYPDSEASQAPEVVAADILEILGEGAGSLALSDDANPWNMYVKLADRTVLEAKAYDWCQRFAEEHSSVLNIYYEDDEFVCYYFRQEAGEQAYELGMK